MTCTGIILHGHIVCVAFSEGHVSQGADWVCELLAYVFAKLKSLAVDLRHYTVNFQSDNCPKEGKNNSICRFFSLAVAKRWVDCARLRYMVSGHSHEDIDQFFSLLGSFLSHESELHTADEFCDALRKYLANPAVRPAEPTRDVIKVDRVRSWILG